MAELISLKDIPKDVQIQILQKLGYDSNGTYVTKEGKVVKDRYMRQLSVRLDNMLILPGSTVILDNNPLSIASFLEEFGERI